MLAYHIRQHIALPIGPNWIGMVEVNLHPSIKCSYLQLIGCPLNLELGHQLDYVHHVYSFRYIHSVLGC